MEIDIESTLKEPNFCIGCRWIEQTLEGVDLYYECIECGGRCDYYDRESCSPLSYKTHNPKKNEWYCKLLKEKLHIGPKPIRRVECRKTTESASRSFVNKVDESSVRKLRKIDV